MRPETPQNRPQYHRLRRIIAMVRDGMADGRLPNRSDFRRELEVSPRTLARSRGSDKTFALSRFGKVATTGKHFKRPAGFDWRSFSREAFGIAHGEKPERVRLLFSANVATYIGERVWHPSQILREHRDGSLEMRIETSGHKELVRWVLSWMPDVRVLAPKSLRDGIALKLAEGLRRNAGNDRAREGG